MVRRQPESPTSPELCLGGLLDKHFPGEWRYTGNGDTLIGGKSPDFLNVNGQKAVIELFGDYCIRKKLRGYQSNSMYQNASLILPSMDLVVSLFGSMRFRMKRWLLPKYVLWRRRKNEVQFGISDYVRDSPRGSPALATITTWNHADADSWRRRVAGTMACPARMTRRYSMARAREALATLNAAGVCKPAGNQQRDQRHRHHDRQHAGRWCAGGMAFTAGTSLDNACAVTVAGTCRIVDPAVLVSTATWTISATGTAGERDRDQHLQCSFDCRRGDDCRDPGG